MAQPRHTKENGAPAPLLDVLPDVLVKKKSPVVAVLLAGY